jgi:glycosyltransferase involved in cell wall biosynthesis
MSWLQGLGDQMFSLIIPTYNRAGILERTLTSIFQLKGIHDCEVIAINDGSNDSTGAVLQRFKAKYPKLLKVMVQDNMGPGAARNAGVQAAVGDKLLFIDDDVFPAPDLIAAHRSFMEQGFDASQGILDWHPDLAGDRLIQFMDRRDMQFGFHRLSPGDQLSFLHVYTANLAVKKSDFLRVGGFDSSFSEKRYAFEDTGFAYNLQKAGVTLGLNTKARAVHYHPMTGGDLVRREYKVGYSFGVLDKKYPEIAEALQLKGKMRLPVMQLFLLHLFFKVFFLKSALSYEMNLRLRCRESFLNGYKDFLDSRGGQHERKR